MQICFHTKFGNLQIFLSILFIFFLAGCKFESTSNIYLADLIDIKESKEPILAESTIKIQVPGKSAYEKNKVRIKDLLSRHFPDIKDLSCEQTGFETFVVARTKIPIWYNANIKGSESSTQILSIMVSNFQKGQKHFAKIFLAVAKDKYLEFKGDFDNEFSGATLSADDFEKIKIILQNGQKDPVTVFGMCVYVNGQPEPVGREIVLERRDSVDLVIPKISIAKAFEAGESPFLLLQLENSNVVPEKVQTQSTPQKAPQNLFQKYKNKK
jgi:hypothetical protein